MNIVITNKWHDADRLSIFNMENNPKYSSTDLEKNIQIKKIQAWHRTSSEISGCIKIKNKLLVEPGNCDIIIAGPLVTLSGIKRPAKYRGNGRFRFLNVGIVYTFCEFENILIVNLFSCTCTHVNQP